MHTKARESTWFSLACAGTFGFQKEMGALDSLRASSAPGKASGSNGAAQNVRALLSSTKEIELRVVRSTESLQLITTGSSKSQLLCSV